MFRFLFTLAIAGSVSAAEFKVAVLHPLLGDLARQVGGESVEVIDLIGPNGDPHHFEPGATELKRAEGAGLYLASGMGLEPYLPKLKTILPAGVTILEVGATLPSLEGACDHEGHDHHDHVHALDPHWWHSIDRFRRATGVVAEAFATRDPDHAEAYRANALEYRGRLDELERWTKREIARIPRDSRHLATAHAAFNYLCDDFGLTSYPVQGINREQLPSAKQLAELVAELREHRVKAIFPERESNPKILETITQDTGIQLADPLIADGTGVSSYEEMVRHNISTLVKALAPASQEPAGGQEP